jgi:hypothetical protein
LSQPAIRNALLMNTAALPAIALGTALTLPREKGHAQIGRGKLGHAHPRRAACLAGPNAQIFLGQPPE